MVSTTRKARAADERVDAATPVEAERVAKLSLPDAVTPDRRHSTAEDLLNFLGTWHGDDLEECLDLVYATRSVWYP